MTSLDKYLEIIKKGFSEREDLIAMAPLRTIEDIAPLLDETLTYEFDQIRIVEPDDISLLEIEEEKDLCTLITCTPYGVNSHRLLVRGHRVENRESTNTIRITADASLIDPKWIAPILAVPVLLVILLVTLLRSLKKEKAKR